MKFPKSVAAAENSKKTITMADGQTFVIVYGRPTYEQRFEDSGKFDLACSGVDGAWASYRLGRLKAIIVDWEDVEGEKGKVPYTLARLLSLFDHDPTIVPQVMEVANRAFAPLAQNATSGDKPQDSGTETPSEPQASDSISNSTDSPN